MSTPSEDKFNIIIDTLMKLLKNRNSPLLFHSLNINDNELFTKHEFENLKPNIKRFLKTSPLFDKIGNDDYYNLSLEGKKIVEEGGYLHHLEQNKLERQIKEQTKTALDEAALNGYYITKKNLLYTQIGVISAVLFGIWGIYQGIKPDSRDEEIKELRKKLNIEQLQYESQQKHLTKIQEKIDSLRLIKVDVKK